MRKSLLLMTLLLLSACGQKEPVTRIVFAEVDNANEPYMSRAIITPEFMRIDYNKDEDDFILFERKSGIIYSVVHKEKNIIVVMPSEITAASPLKLDVEVVKGQLDKSVPDVEGKTPEYYQYKVNGQLCYETISVPGLLPFASKVHKEFLKTLAGEHARIVNEIPADQHDACDLAATIYHYGMKFDHGFPINEWHGEYTMGYKRQVVDYEEGFTYDPALMLLPQDYKRYQPEDIAAN